MPYVSQNINFKYKNTRMTPAMKKVRSRLLDNNQRWEFRRTMYGNVSEIIDHDRMIWYRQDMPVTPEGDLFEGHLPFYCDYCQHIVPHIQKVHYELIFEMLVRPQTDPEWKKTKTDIFFSCCEDCMKNTLSVPERVIGYHMTELRQNGQLIFTQERKA